MMPDAPRTHDVIPAKAGIHVRQFPGTLWSRTSPNSTFTSPLRGEVAAQRRVRGSDLQFLLEGEPLTPTLSPQGRGGSTASSGERVII